VDQFFNDSTGEGSNGDHDVRGPWNEGEGVEYIEAPGQPVAAATMEEVTKEIFAVTRRTGVSKTPNQPRSKRNR